MKLTKVFIIALTLLFGAISISHFREYLILNPDLEQPIAYQVISSKENAFGNGRSFYTAILYKGKEYKLSLTREDYLEIKKGKHPNLYYSADLDLIFHSWNVKRHLRIAMVFSVLFLIGCLWLFFRRVRK